MSQQHFETFDLTIENDIAHICLNRPEKRNSMIPSFWEDLPTAVRDIDDNAKARVIVISSSGPVFTAGMDLNAFTPKDHSSADEAKRAELREVEERFREQLEVPRAEVRHLQDKVQSLQLSLTNMAKDVAMARRKEEAAKQESQRLATDRETLAQDKTAL